MTKIDLLVHRIKKLSRVKHEVQNGNLAISTVIINSAFFSGLFDRRESAAELVRLIHEWYLETRGHPGYTEASRKFNSDAYHRQAMLIGNAIASIRDEGAEPRSAAIPKRPRLELAEGRRQLRIDDQPHSYRGNKATYLLAVLLKAKGDWQPGERLEDPSVVIPRPDKIIKRLPEEIARIIETEKGGPASCGYRIKPEYFD